MSAFDLYAPYIQSYIYKNRWTQLREIQEKACEAILQTSSNVLLTSSTASGKTEAAFFPILTDLDMNPSSTISVLYISPLIALINDQFERLTDLLDEEGISVVKWHGQALTSPKRKVMKSPEGIIQITPESLEALIMREGRSLPRLFGDLRYVVIDEVHSFMGSERGLQLQSQLSRIEQIIAHPVRHIGLSATLNSYEDAGKWLSCSNGLNCVICSSNDVSSELRLSVKECSHKLKREEAVLETDVPLMKDLFSLVQGRKSIVFSNTRKEVEATVAGLHDMADLSSSSLKVFAHHGSLSRLQRGEAEDALKNLEGDVSVGATVTLELGIDVGELDLIVQTGAPISSSSFVQRLGRCGRKGQPKTMAFLLKKIDYIWKNNPTYLPFDLLKTIAVVELYLKEKWVEPIKINEQCFFLLFHQTLSVLKSLGTLMPSSLARRILTLPPFQKISQEDYKILLMEMLNRSFIEEMEDGTLNLGEKGESLTSYFDFYSVFQAIEEITIKSNDKIIGTVGRELKEGDRLVLGGYRWKVVSLDLDKMIAEVVSDGVGGVAKWEGNGSFIIDDRIMLKIHEILEGTDSYSYLSKSAANYLEKTRERYKNLGIKGNYVVQIEKEFVRIYPWVGSRVLSSLEYSLKHLGLKAYKENDFCIAVEKSSVNEVKSTLKTISKIYIDPNEFKLDKETIVGNFKYDRLLPLDLAKKEYISWFFDIQGMKKYVKAMI